MLPKRNTRSYNAIHAKYMVRDDVQNRRENNMKLPCHAIRDFDDSKKENNKIGILLPTSKRIIKIGFVEFRNSLKS